MEPDPPNPAARRIEAYLDQVLAPLTRRLSVFQREELRRELREHLWGRMDAYRELGHSDEEAVTETLKQFGGAKDFARQWRREWLKIPSKLTLREVYEAGMLALRPSLLGLTAGAAPFWILAAVSSHLYGSHIPAEVVIWPLWGFALVFLPLWIGVRQGKRGPRPGVGMLAALSAEGLAAMVLYQVISLAWPGCAAADDALSLTALATFWLPIAGGAAAASGWLSERRKRVPA